MKRWGKIFITLGAIIALLVIVNMILIGIARQPFNKHLEKIKAAGHPISLADLALKPVPDNQNAAVILQSIHDDLDAISTALTNIYREDNFANGNFTDDQLKTIDAAFDAHPKVLPALIQAANAPSYQVDIDPTSSGTAWLETASPRITYPRQIARLLAARIHLLSGQSNPIEALNTSISLFQLCRHFDREPMILGSLVAMSCRALAIRTTNAVLQKSSLPASAHRMLEAELAVQNTIEAYQYALATERVLGLALYEEQMSVRITNWPLRSYFLADACDYLRGIEQLLDFASKPYAAVVEADLPTQISKMKSLARITLSAFAAGRKTVDRIRSELRCLRILNAIKAQGKPQADTPINISELALPAEATRDPFTGNLLQAKKVPQGWVVYSVGANLIDDGGDLDRQKDTGIQPPGIN